MDRIKSFKNLKPVRKKADIKQALKEMNVRRSSAMLDMASNHYPNSIKYDTDTIRRLESIDVTIHVLRWVLNENDVAAKQKYTK